MVGIALLGAGIFAREEHLPAINACEVLELKAVYSRSQTSAEAVASEANPTADVYHDSPAMRGNSLDDLLRRQDIAAVIVCLPITVQPEVIRKAILAGKHVLSEKPVAKDLATGISLLDWYKSQTNPPLWSIAENFRFLKPLEFAAERLREIGGKVATFRFSLYSLINDDDKFLNTDWRRAPEYQGGFVLDAGVHFVAGLRYMLAAAGEEVKHVAAFSNLQHKKLSPVDTVHAIASTQNGSGTFCVSFGTEFKSGIVLEVVTTKGSVMWNGPTVKVVTSSVDGEKLEESKDFPQDVGVKAEVTAFARSLEIGEADRRQMPLEALRDLEILEKLLESGNTGGTTQSVEL